MDIIINNGTLREELPFVHSLTSLDSFRIAGIWSTFTILQMHAFISFAQSLIGYN